MQIILLERIAKLGQMGDEVSVKDGFARNYLLPKGKALRANKANRTRFESERVHLEARNLERKTEAEAIAEKLDGTTYIAVRSAGETGQLYGSVATRDIASLLEENGFSIARNQVELPQPIKTIGMHTITIILHPEVDSSVIINVARSTEEAERQAAGEDMSRRDAFADDDEEALDLDEVFENPDEVDLDGEEADEPGDEPGDEPSDDTASDVEATEEATEEKTTS